MHSSRNVYAVLAILFTLILSSSAASAQTTGLPSGWSSADVAIPALRGSTTYAAETFEVRGAGEGIRLTADEFQFAYRTFSGDIDMTIRVIDLQSTTGQAALMIRESLDYRAPTAAIALTGSQDVVFEARTQLHDWMSVTPGPAAAPGVWLRLVRQGTTFRGYASPDGSSWRLVSSAEIAMSNTALIGLAVSSHDVTQYASARFSTSTSSTIPPATSLPAPWATGDIGQPARTGAATNSSGIFTVAGAGRDIWDATDEFRFVYQPVVGDVEIVARVASLQGTHAWSKAGVMIRGALTGPAAHASFFASTAKGWAFQRRPYSGGSSYHTGMTGTAPGWVRLVREGQLVSAYHSADGSNWVLVGTETVNLSSTAYVGLAVTSHDVASNATATLSNVRVGPLSQTNMPPTVAIVAPSTGVIFTAPANIGITAAAGDSDGIVNGVRFFANSTQIGASTGPVFSLNWANVPAGTYTVTAVATDNGGGSATSSPVLVTVGIGAASSPSIPTRLAFTASTDHDTSVVSYKVELRRATDSATATPVAARDLGKPAPVSGEILTDITTLVDPLSPGSYYAVVVAIGSGGSAASSPSAAFTK
ncbi:MAG TPA: DUF1349 domain-containing protein [Vicinamibacterales bacterium]|nr:DUF1349 domain-containing protein [Vicinamibacterales bacterium]